MTDYWKSNERKYCEYCKCWLSDNKASIAFHENGKRHKMNVEKRISEIGRNSLKADQERKKMDIEIRKMEEAAMRSYAQDINARGDLTAQSISAVRNLPRLSTPSMPPDGRPTTSGIPHPRQIDPMRLPGSSDEEDVNTLRVAPTKVDPEAVPNASLWVEGKSDENYTYYWNVKTNESTWEVPKEGYLSWAEYQRINELAVKQQEIEQANEAKKFQKNVNEEVARFNRERLKVFRKSETAEEKKAKLEKKKTFKSEEEVGAPQIGVWQVVEHRPPPEPVDLQLPKTESKFVPPIVINTTKTQEQPVKRFKEKTIDSLDPELANGISTSFKKRKISAKNNQRQRLPDN